MKKNLKKKFLFILLFIPPLFHSGLNAQQLTIVTTTGSETTDSLIAFKYIVFPDNGIYVSYLDNTELSYQLSEVKVIRFDSGSLIDAIVSENQETGGYILYPNPARSQFSVKNLPSGEMTVRIYRLDGKAVLEQVISGADETINIEDLDAGIYLVRIGGQTSRLIRL